MTLSPDSSPPSVAAPARAPISVALVEDERDIRDSWARLIGSFEGFSCPCACPSGEEALKQIPALKPDLVLMDIFLPRMSGIDCTSRLKALLPDLQILILTAVADDELVFLALQAGADGYLLKSTRPAELRAALLDVRGGGAPMTSAVARRVVRYFHQKSSKPQDASAQLSAREEEVLILLSKGYSNKEIAAQLALSIDTVCSYLKLIYKKLHVHSRTEAASHYLRSKAS
jgi:DNA-binding NarL/FixJ family response regulator